MIKYSDKQKRDTFKFAVPRDFFGNVNHANETRIYSGNELENIRIVGRVLAFCHRM